MLRGMNSNSFTPEDRILQVQYASEATKLGATSIGICTAEVIILAAVKRPVSPLMVAGSLDKIVCLDDHLYCTFAGLSPDARSLLNPARVACANHWMEYGEYMPIEPLMDSISQQATAFGMGEEDEDNSSSSSSSGDIDASSSSDSNAESDAEYRKLLTTCRPYGVAFLFGGVDNGSLQLWHLEPNGDFSQHGIKAVGSRSDAAEEWLLQHYKADMNMEQAMDLALSTMKVIIGLPTLDPSQLDVIMITKGPRCHKLNRKELELEILRRQPIVDIL